MFAYLGLQFGFLGMANGLSSHSENSLLLDKHANSDSFNVNVWSWFWKPERTIGSSNRIKNENGHQKLLCGKAWHDSKAQKQLVEIEFLGEFSFCSGVVAYLPVSWKNLQHRNMALATITDSTHKQTCSNNSQCHWLTSHFARDLQQCRSQICKWLDSACLSLVGPNWNANDIDGCSTHEPGLWQHPHHTFSKILA